MRNLFAVDWYQQTYRYEIFLWQDGRCKCVRAEVRIIKMLVWSLIQITGLF